MFCKQCGNELKDESRFCPDCGTAVNVDPITSGNIPAVKPSSSFFENIKRNMTNSKIAVLILNAILLLSLFVVPFFYITTSKSSYPVHLIGGNDYPSHCLYDEKSDIGWTLLLFIFIGAIGCIVYSLLVGKIKFCTIAAAANLGVSVFTFISILISTMESRSKYSNFGIAPIGILIHIGVSIAILVFVTKLAKRAPG